MNSDDQLRFNLARREPRAHDRHHAEIDTAETQRRLAMTLDELEHLYIADDNLGAPPRDATGVSTDHAASSPRGEPATPPGARDSTGDRILDILDAGLQRAIGKAPGHTTAPPGMCTRCQTHRTNGPNVDFCPGCRAYLLGDTDLDPATRLPVVGLIATHEGPVRAIRAPDLDERR